jgi:hypothetical protein
MTPGTEASEAIPAALVKCGFSQNAPRGVTRTNKEHTDRFVAPFGHRLRLSD